MILVDPVVDNTDILWIVSGFLPPAAPGCLGFGARPMGPLQVRQATQRIR
jgi:hypothetical protein